MKTLRSGGKGRMAKRSSCGTRVITCRCNSCSVYRREIEAGHETIPLFLQMYEHPNYRANAAIIFGTQVENTDLFPQQAELAGQWNNVYAYPRMQYSGFYDALKNIADQFGDNIPTVRGDGGPYWEDGMAADAYYAAMERAQ